MGAPAYRCEVTTSEGTFEAQATITDDGIELRGNAQVTVPFVDLMDIRLLNYHLHLHLREDEVVVSKLGYQTEAFFEKTWEVYAQKSLESLFVSGKPNIACEGDYAYTEPDVSKKSIAKLELRDESLCIAPHDVGTRRVPLCFASEPVRNGFSLTVALDTGESYTVSRLGRNTDPFFKGLMRSRESAVRTWEEAHRALTRDLDTRLGEAAGRYRAFQALGTPVEIGLFSADDEAFWFAAIGEGRAAVELVCGEKTATYLYCFSTSAASFTARLRHAMEAVKRHRRLIFLSDDELAEEPLFRMAVDRSTHVRFLRACNVGRIVHTANWESKLAGFIDKG